MSSSEPDSVPTPSGAKKFLSRWSILDLGIALFVVSFFLPAVRENGNLDSGAFCAVMAFFGLGNEEVNGLAVFGGLINPIAIVYLVLRIREKAPKARLFLAGAILVFIPLTWVSLIMMHMEVWIGHVAWIAGLLLMIDWNDSETRTFPQATRATAIRVRDQRKALKILSLWAATALVIVVVGYVVRSTIYKPLVIPSPEDYFFEDVAARFRAPDVCAKINPDAEGSGGGMSAPGYQVSYLRSNCYFTLASETGDLTLCDKVKTAHKDLMDGSKYSPKGCREHGVGSLGIPSGVSDENFDRIMQKLGYGEQILAIHYARSPELEVALAADNNLTQKLKSSQGFDEPLSPYHTRVPDDLELIYYPMALDDHAPDLCAKISPNAVVPARNIRLRLLCYSQLAYKDHMPQLCDELPENPVPRDGGYTRASCRADISGPNIPGAQYWYLSSWFFAPPASLLHGLHEIGTELPPAHVPHEEYWGFFNNLVFHSDPGTKSEFIRRVMAME